MKARLRVPLLQSRKQIPNCLKRGRNRKESVFFADKGAEHLLAWPASADLDIRAYMMGFLK